MSISLIGVVIATAAGFGLAKSLEKGKKGPNVKGFEIMDDESSLQRKISLEKEDSKKDVLDIMIDLVDNDGLSQFTLVEKKQDTYKYQFLKNDILFTINYNEDSLKCTVESNEVKYLEYNYDLDWDDFDKKAISRSIIELRERDESLDIIDDFITEVNDYYWDKMDENTEIYDDIKTLKPYVVKNELFEEKKENEENENFFVSIKESIQNKDLSEEVSEAFTSVISKIEAIDEDFKEIEEELDVESKHIYEELVKKDLIKVHDAFLRLEIQNREKFKEDILNAIIIIEKKVDDLSLRVESKNINEISSILGVIKQRYN